MIKRDLQDWTKHISNGKLLKQGKDPFCFYPIVDGEKILTGSVTTACDSVLQFINKTNSQYNFTPAINNTTNTIILPQNTFQNRTHAHRQSNQQSHSIGIGNATITNISNSIAHPALSQSSSTWADPHTNNPHPPENYTSNKSTWFGALPDTCASIPNSIFCLLLGFPLFHNQFFDIHRHSVYCCFNLYFLHFSSILSKEYNAPNLILWYQILTGPHTVPQTIPI